MSNVEPRWRKSSYSSYNGSCVEFRRSSWCAAGECAEVAADGSVVAVRDSKLGPLSPVLSFNRSDWERFTAALKAG